MDESTPAPIIEQVSNVGLDGQAVPPPVVEEKPPAPPAEDPEFAKRFAILTRKEREILAQAERIKGDIEGVNQWKKDKDLLKSDPHKFLEAHGWKFNDLVDFTLSNGKKTPEQQIQALQQQIEEMRNEKTQEKESSQKSDIEKNIATYKAEQKTYLAGKADTYELLNHFESFDMVYDIMNQHFIATKGQETLDIDRVAAEVEKYLEGQLEKATSTKKFKSRFAPSTQVTSEGKPAGTDTKSPTTLTNSDIAGASTATRSEYLDDDASKRRAAKILEEAWKRQK